MTSVRVPRVQLPWTRREVESLATLFEQAVVLVGSDASEARLNRLIDQRRLSRFVQMSLNYEVDLLEYRIRAGEICTRGMAAHRAGAITFDVMVRSIRAQLYQLWQRYRPTSRSTRRT